MTSAPGRLDSSPEAGETLRITRVLGTVLWFAIVTGFLEALFLLGKWRIFDRFTWSSVHVIWMAPVANGLLLLFPALALGLVARFRPHWLTLARLSAILVFGMAMCLLIVGSNGALALWAVVLIALGISIRFGSAISRHEQQFSRIIRRTTPALAALVVVLALLVPGWMALRERTAVKALQSTGNRPNVLLIILDTVRSASMSLYDSTLMTTPHLNRWASDAVVFHAAQASAPWTLPSHASMFTGHWPHELRAGWKTPLANDFPTLAELLQEHGYVTAGFVANHYYTTRQSGLSRGFIYYDDLPLTPKEVLRSSLLGQVAVGLWSHGKYTFQPERSTARRDAGEISQAFLRWLPRHRDRPWFVFLNYFDAHRPYRVPLAFTDSLPHKAGLVGQYERSIHYLDRELGSLLAELDRQGYLRNSIVVITSDHGEEFGGHGVSGHGNSLYRSATQVPLIIKHPGYTPAGLRIAQPVSLRDLAPTILELANIRDHTIDGVSLASIWRNGEHYPDTVLTELLEKLPDVENQQFKTPMYSLMTREFRYIRQANGTEEIYETASDPDEQTNLADSVRGRRVLPQLRAALARRIAPNPL